MNLKHILDVEKLKGIQVGDLIMFVGRPIRCDLLKSAEYVIFVDSSEQNFQVQTIRRLRHNSQGELNIQRSVYDGNSLEPWIYFISNRNLPNFPFEDYDRILKEVIKCGM